MSQETRCPKCETANLITPLIRFRNKDGRKAKSMPIKFCRHCNFIIDESGTLNYQIKGEIIYTS